MLLIIAILSIVICALLVVYISINTVKKSHTPTPTIKPSLKTEILDPQFILANRDKDVYISEQTIKAIISSAVTYDKFNQDLKGNNEILLDNLKSVYTKSFMTSLLQEHNMQPLYCYQVRILYHEFIEYFVSLWQRITNERKTENKYTCQGYSYIRWLGRVTSRYFTDEKDFIAKKFCNPKILEARDNLKYNCKPDTECPPISYLDSRLNLEDAQPSDPKWQNLCNSSLRTNDDYNLMASLESAFRVIL